MTEVETLKVFKLDAINNYLTFWQLSEGFLTGLTVMLQSTQTAVRALAIDLTAKIVFGPGIYINDQSTLPAEEDLSFVKSTRLVTLLRCVN